VGEIGRDRREYLYEMSWREILLIIRGYRRRNVLLYQLQRLTAYGALFAMSGDKQQKGPEGWIPLYVDRYITEDVPVISEEEEKEMLEEIAALNKTE